MKSVYNRREERLDYIGDSPEKIQMCLNCTRPRCTDCLSSESARQGVIAPMKRSTFNWSPPKISDVRFMQVGCLSRKVHEHYCKGMTMQESADIIGKSTSYVSHMRSHLGLKALPKMTREMLIALNKEGIDTVHTIIVNGEPKC